VVQSTAHDPKTEPAAWGWNHPADRPDPITACHRPAVDATLRRRSGL